MTTATTTTISNPRIKMMATGNAYAHEGYIHQPRPMKGRGTCVRCGDEVYGAARNMGETNVAHISCKGA